MFSRHSLFGCHAFGLPGVSIRKEAPGWYLQMRGRSCLTQPGWQLSRLRESLRPFSALRRCRSPIPRRHRTRLSKFARAAALAGTAALTAAAGGTWPRAAHGVAMPVGGDADHMDACTASAAEFLKMMARRSADRRAFSLPGAKGRRGGGPARFRRPAGLSRRVRCGGVGRRQREPADRVIHRNVRAPKFAVAASVSRSWGCSCRGRNRRPMLSEQTTRARSDMLDSRCC